MGASYSSGTAYAECPRAWYLTDRADGLGYRAPYPASYQFLGTAVHRALGVYYRRVLSSPLEAFELAAASMVEDIKQKAVVLMPDEVDKLDSAVALGKGMMRTYEDWVSTAVGPYTDSMLEFLPDFVEHPWHAKIGSAELEGTMDLVARDHNGILWVVEHKTTSDPTKFQADVQYSYQPYLYAWYLARIFSEEQVGGVLYNLIVKRNPWDIFILKNGLPTQNKSVIGGTPIRLYQDLLDRCIAENEFDQGIVYDKYADTLDYLRMEGSNLVIRYPFSIPSKMAWANVYYLIQLAQDMQQTKALGENLHWEALRPNKNQFRCPGCPMKFACLLIDDGQDPRSYLESTFIVERKETDEETDE